MSSKQTDRNEPYSGRQDVYSDRSETKRQRQYSTQSHDTEVSCMSQETVTTGLSFETDCNTSESKRSYGRSVSFCLANENEDITDDPCNDSEIRDSCIDNAFKNNISLRPQSNDSADHVYNCISNEERGQENMPRPVFNLPMNNSRGCRQNSFSEENCRQPLIRRQSTFSKGTINEHPNESELEAWYAGLQCNFKNSVYPCACKFDHSQCQKLCSSVRVLEKVVFVLCVFNIIFLIALIVVPTFTVLYIQAGKESNPVAGQLPSTSDEQRHDPSCVKCESLMKKFPTFIKTQNAIKSIGDDDGTCCFSDPRKLMTILNQISEESIERAKGSVCISCPSGTSDSVITPAVHLKSRGNGLINASEVFVRKRIESTHFVGWQRSVSRDHQGLWGQLNENGASVRVKSPGMYFIYAMIQHKGSNLTTSGSDNMNTTVFDMPRAPLKVALYICPHGIDGEQGSCSISAISQKYYSSDTGAHQNTYFGRLFYLKENENVYLGISGDAFVHKESESHYLGFYKV
ncbi:hypothetical protein CHS0354_002585 [Potamilus streckersoni]|uniref:THD domain-containing protein n=1 Tax=Potamilus streckersoni TaxID=2493646 RepID=A0AAE0RNI0_9BIVA|nr:hypothetical protein CHS0354_002585 [Potamilus streckersoni]